MQRETVLATALNLLEQQGLNAITLEMVASHLSLPVEELRPFWPDQDALLYDSLRFHAQQIDTWRRKVLLDDNLTIEQKLLARYQVLEEQVRQQRYPGCLFIAACSHFPQEDHPIRQLAEQQKKASFDDTQALLQQLDTDDAEMVAEQMELVQEGCLSKLLVHRQLQDVAVAKRLAADILQLALCRKNGALS